MADEQEEPVDDNKDGKISLVESIRHSMRPYLVFWFSTIYAVVVLYGVYSNKLEVKDAVMAVEGVVSAIIGYHFGKSSKIDK